MRKLNNAGKSTVLVIILSLIALLVIGGFGLWYVMNQQTTEVDPTSTDSGQPASAIFEPIEPPYTITSEVTDANNPDLVTTATIEFESNDLWSITTRSGDDVARVVYTADYTYTTTEGQTIRLPYSGDTSGTQIDSYSPSDEQLSDYRNNATRIGTERCGDEQCDVYEVTDDDTTSTLFVSQSTNRLVRIESVDENLTIVTSFDYNSEVNVEVPTDYQELPS